MLKSIELCDLLSFLDRQNQQDFTGHGIAEYLTEHQITVNQFTPFIFFREDGYGRNLVSKNGLYELLVLTWLPNQRTPIHDHAGQRCWMMVQSGTLVFKNYAPAKGDDAPLVPIGSIETHREGESAYIDDTIAVHSITNPSKLPAVSVHLYAGPIPECRIYNEDKRRFEWVGLTYFTQAQV